MTFAKVETNIKGLTLKNLQKKTGAPLHTIVYLKNCLRLPIIRESPGRGFPNLYHPDCVKVIQDHQGKQKDE